MYDFKVRKYGVMSAKGNASPLHYQLGSSGEEVVDEVTL